VRQVTRTLLEGGRIRAGGKHGQVPPPLRHQRFSKILILPPITNDSAKLDPGAMEGLYDGNLSTCDYLRVNWTRSLDCDSQNGTVSSS